VHHRKAVFHALVETLEAPIETLEAPIDGFESRLHPQAKIGDGFKDSFVS